MKLIQFTKELPRKIQYRFGLYLGMAKLYLKIFTIEKYVQKFDDISSNKAPIFLVNITSSPTRPSFMQLVLLITGWILRVRGEKVKIISCNGALSPCPQGGSKNNVFKEPPCRRCKLNRGLIFNKFEKISLNRTKTNTVNCSTGINFQHNNYKVGEYVIHTLRHFFKRYNLELNSNEEFIYKKFNTSSVDVINQFEKVVESEKPKKVVIFNGIFFPEASIRSVCERKGIDHITYEMGFHEMSSYFSEKIAPAYEIDNRSSFLSEAENKKLDTSQWGLLNSGVVLFLKILN